MIQRVYDKLGQFLEPQRVLVLLGSRRVGKTTLLNNFLQQTSVKYLLVSGDNARVQQILGSHDFSQILPFVEGYQLFAIDEAQQVSGIGRALKIIVDQVSDIQVIATGSSAFDIAQAVGEPLTGRKRTLHLYPLSQMELLHEHNKFELQERLAEYLIYGTYPEVVSTSSREKKREILEEITHSYLFKDIVRVELEKGSKLLLDLLKLLAFQIGSEVSLTELATQLQVNVRTVDRYLYLLEQAFVIIRLGGFSRNLRSEVTQKQKYYFLDNGIRNAVISQFNTLDSRNDIGQLWENFLFIERVKKVAYQKIYGNQYFWRTYEQQEIDLVEERDGKLYGYEFKWSGKKEISPPKDWLATYPDATFTVITPDNYFDFIT